MELLQGRFAKGVMERLCRQGDGLFSVPKEIRFGCSCPDGAYMCTHVAAVLYGIGARFDHQPELLFTLRQVEAADLLAKADSGVTNASPTSERTLAGEDVGALFGLEMDDVAPSGPAVHAPAPEKAKAVAAKRPVTPKPHQAPRRTPKPRQARDPLSRLRAALRAKGSLASADAQAVTGLDAAGVRPLLQRLVAEGEVTVEGQKLDTRYVAT